MELEDAAVRPARCVEAALDLVGPLAAKKQPRARLRRRAATCRRRSSATQRRLRQILLNLLGNAVKFTEHGRGRADRRARRRRRGDGRVELDIAVRDTGIGIPADRMDRLFQSFSQADASTTRQLRRHRPRPRDQPPPRRADGRHVWARERRRRRRGLDVPLHDRGADAPSAPTRAAAASQPALAGRRAAGRRRQRHQPALLVHAARALGDGAPRDASRRPRRSSWLERGEPFDLAVLDLHMPEMDGVALARGDPRATTGPSCRSCCSARRPARGPRDARATRFAAYLIEADQASRAVDALVGAARRGDAARRRRAPPGRASTATSASAIRCASCSPRTTR